MWARAGPFTACWRGRSWNPGMPVLDAPASFTHLSVLDWRLRAPTLGATTSRAADIRGEPLPLHVDRVDRRVPPIPSPRAGEDRMLLPPSRPVAPAGRAGSLPSASRSNPHPHAAVPANQLTSAPVRSCPHRQKLLDDRAKGKILKIGLLFLRPFSCVLKLRL